MESIGKERVALSIDPGSAKCGIAVVGERSGVLAREILPTAEVPGALEALIKVHKPDIILLGSGTTAKKLKAAILPALQGLPLEIVNEKHSTERARAYYFREHPPRGLWKLVPLGLQVPPVPYDDYAAAILAEDWFRSPEKKEVS
jgi:RNase H-fold protein (predicted Holliday junction resolvase)